MVSVCGHVHVLTSPGVVVLDTTVVPDVVGLCSFDDRAPVVRMLPGDFGNTVRVLVPDVRAEPHRDFVRHECLSCPTSVCRGPDRTETALAVLPVVCND